MTPPTNPNPNTFESKEQGAHENPMKIAQKRHENHTSYKKQNQCNHECFHTLGGHILFKMVKTIYAYGARK
jgi:hypothetical protein